MSTNFEQNSGFNLDIGNMFPTQLGSRLRWIFILVGLVSLFFILSIIRSIYTDWLWFNSLEFQSVYIKILLTRVILFCLAAGIFAIFCGISVYFSYQLSKGPEEIPLPPQIRRVFKRLIFWGILLGVSVLSIIFGVIAASQWEVFLRFDSAAIFNTTDPVYNKDISFYVFALPLYEFIQKWALGATVIILAATLGIYFVQFSFRGVGLIITKGIKLQISTMGAIIMLLFGVGLWLDRWGLLFSGQGAVFGAAYTDIHARKIALLILLVAAAATAILIFINAYLNGIRLFIGALALFAGLFVALNVLWPNAMQRLTVRPSEFAREQPYIERNIEFTRQGFGLGGIIEQPYPVDAVLTENMVNQNLQTVDNIRLWDHSPLSNVYRQIQLIRPYYDFKDADVDRYVVGGQYRQVMLAAREVAPTKLDVDAQTWVNQKLRYTHGFGIAMSPVTEFTTEGRPEFFAKDIPLEGEIEIKPLSGNSQPEFKVSNPRIYYGEETIEHVIVNTNTAELDYQAAGGELRSTKYFGKGGIEIGNFVRKLAYAWQFADINILISPEITNVSRIQYRREIQERISTVAPFLILDKDPYIVADSDGLFWIQDAYTTSDKYPYSDPSSDGFNYIRNSVKIIVDAFNGTLSFYVWDPTDPMILTYQAIFPDLFIDKDEMPDSLKSHVRYPQDLFSIQSEKYLRYHMLDPQDFYNLEDIWSIPEEKFGQGEQLQEVEPYYVIMKMPGEDKEEFVLLLPYTRNDPPIMSGWLAARNDSPNYGELIAFRFPKERQVDSPQQVEARIDNDPYISQWFTLRCQEGSFCIRGNLLVIPIATDSEYGLLYAEPVYLQAEGIDFPELKQVILATGEKVVMADSVPEAIAELTGFQPNKVDKPKPAVIKAKDAENPISEGIDRIKTSINDIKDSLIALEKALQTLTESTQNK